MTSHRLTNNFKQYCLKKALIASALACLLISLLLLAPINHASDTFDEYDDDVDIKATYIVDPKTLKLTLKEGKKHHSDQLTWAAIINLLPHDMLKSYVPEFQIFTDGVDGTLAFVEQADRLDSPHLWYFAIDLADVTATFSDDAVATIVHEFAHIVALNETQLSFYTEECTTYEIEEGCAETDSYLLEWVDMFWYDDAFIAHEMDSNALVGEAQEDAVIDFYALYEEDFVSEYAATNPIEDFAESFALFVLSNKPSRINTTADEKIAFFYNFSELTKMRDAIRLKTKTRFTQETYGLVCFSKEDGGSGAC